MKHIQYVLVGLILGLSALWLAADTVWSDAFAIFSFRVAMLNFTGIVAIGAMSVAMLLALRPRGRVESFLGGLDKSYRLHKWLGITALVMAVAHWLVGATSAPRAACGGRRSAGLASRSARTR